MALDPSASVTSYSPMRAGSTSGVSKSSVSGRQITGFFEFSSQTTKLLFDPPSTRSASRSIQRSSPSFTRKLAFVHVFRSSVARSHLPDWNIRLVSVRARAPSVPGRTGTHRSAFAAMSRKTGSTTTTCEPLRLASMILRPEYWRERMGFVPHITMEPALR